MPAGLSKPPQGEIDDREPKQTLVLRFDSEDAFRREFAENLAIGAVFVPTTDSYEVGQPVEIRLVLAFCDSELTLPGEIVASVASPVAELGAGAAGASVRLADSQKELRRTLSESTGLDLSPKAPPGRPRRRTIERSDTDADIVISTDAESIAGNTANLSYAGVLALIPMKRLAVGSEVRVHLSTPMVELELTVDGKVVHVQRCDGGVNAHGIQLHYPAERIDEVMAFIEFLQSFDRARRLATVAGDLDESGLASTLEMFVNTAPGGTLVVQRGDETGKIVFSENFILHCSVGMVSGVKALARLARWTSGRFELHHDLQLPENPGEPQAFGAAMMMASVQLDEMARIGFDTFQPNDTFSACTNASGVNPETLTDLEREVREFALDGFNVGAISDMLTAPDADIFKALAVLVDVGLIARHR
jgi:Tfp pilus assembly protein PilZ